MNEKIGSVTLDYSKYPVEDYYCDGAMENEILEIVKNHTPAEFTKIIEERKSWPILYHLSSLRENIVDWIPMDKNSKVLEVGSGCGAITGALSKKAGSVTCVDLSKKRSHINAHRHKECDNVKIHVGKFKDIEPDLDQDYDYICLIGVFQYGQNYIGGETPFEDFLTILMKHLSNNGRIIIAIENKYGLKYFAGCKEDHLGTYFSGIENYADGGDVRTFSKGGLERIFSACGVKESSFYYPYPDYKFMTSIYSDTYLPGKGELNNNYRNFDRDRMLLFDEKNAFDGIIEDGLFPVFSNSYVAVIGKSFDIKFAKYSNDRAKEYAIKTTISKDDKGEIAVRKYPLYEETKEHIEGMAIAYEGLLDRYKGSKLSVNNCKLERNQNNDLCVQFEFVEGTPLSEIMDKCLEQGNIEEFYVYFNEFVERIGYNNDYPVADFDMVFSNILVNGDEWTLIDYEWTFGKQIDTKEIAYRAIYCYLLEDEKRSRLDVTRLVKKMGITEEIAAGYREQEIDFQKFVTGQKCSMQEIRDLIGYQMIVPQKWLDQYKDSDLVYRVQIYEDLGDGFKEEESYFVQDAYHGENMIELELEVSNQVQKLRIDPSMDSCMVKILKMTFNGVQVPLENRKVLISNGKIIKNVQPSIVFETTDPNINIDIQKLEVLETNVLYTKIEIVRISAPMATDMSKAVKKIF